MWAGYKINVINNKECIHDKGLIRVELFFVSFQSMMSYFVTRLGL